MNDDHETTVIEDDSVRDHVSDEADAREGAETDYDSSAPLRSRSSFYVARKSVREFIDDGCPDLAAALTFYSVLAIFPALIALVSVLGVIGQAESAITHVLDVLRPLVSDKTLADVEPSLRSVASSKGAGLGLVLGLLGALWSASAYVGAFGRAMNRILEVEEGRPFWKLRPSNILVTLASVVLMAVALVILVVSGPVARSVGDVLGVGDQALTVWNYAKWPVLALVVIVVVAMLYHFTPNVKFPKFRILTVGAFVAIVVWLVASVGFAFYVANFGSYNKTYGAVAGVVIALVWIWLTNLALLFGAEIDAESERARQLHRGRPSEEQLLLPLRDDRTIAKTEKRRAKDAEAGRAVRESRLRSGSPDDVPF